MADRQTYRYKILGIHGCDDDDDDDDDVVLGFGAAQTRR
jgi:hypothetical protein